MRTNHDGGKRLLGAAKRVAAFVLGLVITYRRTNEAIDGEETRV